MTGRSETPGSNRAGRDRGSASVAVLAVGLVLVAAGVAGAVVGSATVARQQARTAADLAALAGAGHTVHGGATACTRAGEVAAANGGHLTGCRVDGLDLTVTVAVEPAGPAGLAGPAVVTARAGPVRSPVDASPR